MDISHEDRRKQIQTDKTWETQRNASLPTVLRGVQGEEGIFDLFLNL
jgi:hypothetical protein